MDLAELWRAVLTHKVIAGLLLCITVVAGVGAFVKAPVTYQTEADIVLLAPTTQLATGTDAAPGDASRTVNPFLSFGGSQQTAAQVLVVRMGDDAVGKELQAEGVDEEWKFEVKSDVIQITARGATPNQAVASAQHIVDDATDQLTALQREAGSPDDQLIRASVVTAPSQPTRVYDSNVRLAVFVVALGLLVTVSIPAAIEGVARHTDDASMSTSTEPDGAEATAPPRRPTDDSAMRSGR